MSGVTLTGSVIKKLFAQGSKSERQAVMLITEKKEYVLRQDGGPVFGDEVIDGLVGKKIKGDGKVLGYTFILSDWEEVE
jgi:hypothetical protein